MPVSVGASSQVDTDCHLSQCAVRMVTDVGPDLLRGFRAVPEPQLLRALADDTCLETGGKALVPRGSVAEQRRQKDERDNDEAREFAQAGDLVTALLLSRAGASSSSTGP